MQLLESGEMYLETIYRLSQTQNAVRSLDVALALGFSKPSVSRAVGILKSGGFLVMDVDNYLSLTELGLEVAKKIYERHMLLTACLLELGVDEETATEDACKIEHVISDASIEAIKRFVERKSSEI